MTDENAAITDLEPEAETGNPEQTQSTEKLLKQSEVDRIVHSRTRDALNKGMEKGRQIALEEMHKQQTSTQPSTENASQMGGMHQYTPEQIQAMIDTKLRQHHAELQAQHTVNEFVEKMRSGKDKYPDFEEAIQRMNVQNLAPIVELAHNTDNTIDIMYDLSKNPTKIVDLLALTQLAPELAKEEIQKLSASIKTNEAAKKTQLASAPLGHVQPSSLSSDSDMTIDDWRNQDWLRG